MLLEVELIEVLREVLLSADLLFLGRLRHPLVHRFLNELAHVVAHHVTEGRCVVYRSLPERVLQERVQVAVEGLGHELDVT